jgi:hypothetical protein
MDGGYAGNAGAFSGGCVNGLHPEKRNAVRLTCMPKMHEQFSAGASIASIPKSETACV